MKNIWSAVFNRAVVDGNSNSLSLFDCVEEVTIGFANSEDLSKSEKSLPIKFSVVGLWLDDSGDYSKERKFIQVLEIIDPSGKKLGDFSIEAVFGEGKKRLRSIVEVDGMKLTTEGEYNIVVKHKKKDGKFEIVSRIPIDINFLLNAPIDSKK